MVAVAALAGLVIGTVFGILIAAGSREVDHVAIAQAAELRGRNIERRARGDDVLVPAPQFLHHHFTPGGPIQ